MNLFLAPFLSILAPLVAGAAISAAKNPTNTSLPPGLLFHSIVPKTGIGLSQLSCKCFSEFLTLLKSQNKHTVSVSDLRESIHSINDSVALTFDDGLEDFYTHAFPLLEEKNMKATLFPVASFIGKEVKWDVFGKKRHVSKAMLREISDRGHCIGSHSLTHANLIWLGSKMLKQELLASKQILEDITGKEIDCISFPFGGWNARVWECAKEVGYKSATVYRGHSKATPELLPVYGVYRFDTASEIFKRAFPGSSWSNSRTIALLMSHFSKGSPLWTYRKEYDLWHRS
ncbi:polysaccharide deacetylase family protein [Chitinispirillales bacterium ANBcel5]|uniref:polysaccharide deacetylase family protein n=1 Tax=Cellulosispirillum alkaliphilum TaxID=3039283 RepID=UPI002A4EC2DF|nr:polysaccharide deacetylase family protein [Chitinispirillales bacterium ANBcel5]